MRKKYVTVLRLIAATLAVSLIALAGPVSPASAAGPNLAAGKTATVSGVSDVYGASNLNDGNPSTYWESNNNAFPQWAQIDLGAVTSVNQVILKLPPTTAWATRTQTLSVLTGTSGSPTTTTVGSAGYTFNPATGNTVTINFTATNARYVRVNITGNTGWPAGQLSEFEVYGPVGSGNDTTAPSAPSNLAYTQPGSGQIRLTWGASTDLVGVTGYDVYANNALRASVAGNVLTYTDTQPTTATVSYYVRAKDAAGNQSSNSNTVTRTGSGGGGGSNLAVGKAITASGTVHTFVATNANDNNTATYWEGNGQPSTITVQLGSNASVNSVVLKLNPDSSWGTRTQTVQVLGREQNATGFTNLSSATAHTFNPATGNTVTIPVTATVADVQLRFTTNTGAPPTRSRSSRSSALPPRTRT
ncbi:discoidin domain-containing protein [Streptosporangium lutulentum]